MTQTDRISGIASAALFITLFLPWFGVRFGVATYSATVTADGLSSHGYLYVVLIGTLALLGYLTARAGWGELALNRTVAHRQLMALVTGVDLVLVLLGFLFRPGGSGVGWEYGAFLGLIAAIVAAVPGLIPALLARGARN